LFNKILIVVEAVNEIRVMVVAKEVMVVNTKKTNSVMISIT